MNGVERYGLIALCVIFGVALGVLFHGLAPHDWGWLLAAYSIAVGLSVAVVLYGARKP